MQAAAFEDKKGGNSDSDKDDYDLDYENFTLTFENWDQQRGSHPEPVNRALPRLSSDTLQVPTWLHRAVMSLYPLLALTCLFFMTLSILILLKNSEMSRELLSLKRELWNASNAAQEYQKAQMKNWMTNFGDAIKAAISEIETKVQEVSQVKKNTQMILELLRKNTSTSTPE